MNPLGNTSHPYAQQNAPLLKHQNAFPHGMVPLPTPVLMPYYSSLPPHMDQLSLESAYTQPGYVQYTLPPTQQQTHEYYIPNAMHNDDYLFNIQNNPYLSYQVPYNSPYIEESNENNEFLNACYGPGPSISTSTDRICGPKGCNLFVFHLPNDMTNWDLYQLFKRFGNILSVHTMINPKTGLSKGFGFVSYDTADAVDEAITSMNGFRLGKKRLKVQRKKNDNYPYVGKAPLNDLKTIQEQENIAETTKDLDKGMNLHEENEDCLLTDTERSEISSCTVGTNRPTSDDEASNLQALQHMF